MLEHQHPVIGVEGDVYRRIEVDRLDSCRCFRLTAAEGNNSAGPGKIGEAGKERDIQPASMRCDAGRNGVVLVAGGFGEFGRGKVLER